MRNQVMQRQWIPNQYLKDIVQTSVPPSKANCATLYSRISRWSVFGCETSGDALGGEEISSMVMDKIPLKVVTTCTFSEFAWLQNKCQVHCFLLLCVPTNLTYLIILLLITIVNCHCHCLYYSLFWRACVIQGTDSLPTNVSVAAMEQQAFLQKKLGSAGLCLL